MVEKTQPSRQHKPRLFLDFIACDGSIGVLVFGSLGAIVALKGGDQTLRYSLDKSTAELLHLPLPIRIKMQVKWFIDTVVWRLGDGLSGLAVLLFANTLKLPVRQISWVVFVLVAVWPLAVFVARRQYVATLKENVSQHRLDVEQASAPVPRAGDRRAGNQ